MQLFVYSQVVKYFLRVGSLREAFVERKEVFKLKLGQTDGVGLACRQPRLAESLFNTFLVIFVECEYTDDTDGKNNKIIMSNSLRSKAISNQSHMSYDSAIFSKKKIEFTHGSGSVYSAVEQIFRDFIKLREFPTITSLLS